MQAGDSAQCGNLLLFLSKSNPQWILVCRLCGLVQAATSAWIVEAKFRKEGNHKTKWRERVAWAATTAHFRHLKITAAFFLFLCVSFPQKDYGGTKGGQPWLKGKKLHKVICTAWDLLMLIGYAPQLTAFDQSISHDSLSFNDAL